MRALSLWLAAGCAPPPAVEPATEEPSIRILYPEEDQELVLGPGCVLTEPIVVDVRGFTLVEGGVNADGEGHWHGGPDLGAGYCMSWTPWCAGRPGEPVKGERRDARYVGQGRLEGLLTLQVELQTNQHEPIANARDQVEVLLVPADGETCP